jgi:hypothetical protein
MQKPVPEDFGITTEEYKQAKEQLTRLSEIHVQKNDANILVIISVGILSAILIGIGTEWIIKFIPIIREGLGPWAGIASFFLLGPILCDYFNKKEERRYLKELSKPIYRKIKLYEDTLERYQQKKEEYWNSLKGVKFEKALERLYSDLGYSVHRTKASYDEGIDLVLQKDNKKIIVQCKGHEKPIGVGAIRDLYGTMMHSGAESAVLACPVGFTEGVRKFAKGKPIELLAAKELVDMAERAQNKPCQSVSSMTKV